MSYIVLATCLSVWKLDLWYAVPLIAGVSLVYAATRHEKMKPILMHAGHTVVWITTFMAVIFAIIQALSWVVG